MFPFNLSCLITRLSEFLRLPLDLMKEMSIKVLGLCSGSLHTLLSSPAFVHDRNRKLVSL